MDPTSDQGVPPVPKGRLDPKQLPNVRSLGKGLSGFIYQTTWSGQGRYARKDFPLRSLKRSGVFEEEAKVLLELDHPNLVRCLGFTVGRSSSSLVQEYVDDDLQNVVQRRTEAQRVNSTSNSRVVDDIEEIKSLLSSKGKGSTGLANGMPRNNFQFEMREAEDIISQIAAGMKYLHDNKIAHGDLKPKNVLLSLDESGKTKGVKIADYGLCGTKKLIRLVSKRTRHFEILTWKAPERFEELLGPVTEDSDHPFTDSDIDSDEDMGRDDDFPRSSPAMADVYSFGLTCSYVLGAKLVFPELSLTQLRGERQRDLCFSLPPTCPDYLQSMTASCLRSDPVSRPTFSAICSTLTEYGGERRSVDAKGKMKAVFTSHNYGDETDAASDKSASTSLYSPQALSFLSIKKPGPQVEETKFNWKWGGGASHGKEYIDMFPEESREISSDIYYPLDVSEGLSLNAHFASRSDILDTASMSGPIRFLSMNDFVDNFLNQLSTIDVVPPPDISEYPAQSHDVMHALTAPILEGESSSRNVATHALTAPILEGESPSGPHRDDTIIQSTLAHAENLEVYQVVLRIMFCDDSQGFHNDSQGFHSDSQGFHNDELHYLNEESNDNDLLDDLRDEESDDNDLLDDLRDEGSDDNALLDGSTNEDACEAPSALRWMGKSSMLEYLTAQASEHWSPSSRSFLSTVKCGSIVEGMGKSLEVRGEITLEEEIEQSKQHWSLLVDNLESNEVGEGVVAKVDNVEVFKNLQMHPTFGRIFGTFGHDMGGYRSLGELVVGEKIAEGAQAEIYHAQVTWKHAKVVGMHLQCEPQWVVKVFKEGTFLRHLLNHGYLQWTVKDWNNWMSATHFGSPRYNRVVLFEDGRFALLMKKEDRKISTFDLRSLIDRQMTVGSNEDLWTILL